MDGPGFHPEACTEKNLFELSHSEAPALVSRSGTNEANTSGRDERRQVFEQRPLPFRREVVEDVHEQNIPSEVTGLQDVADLEVAGCVMGGGHTLGESDFLCVEIDAEKWRRKSLFAEVEREKADAAADVEDRKWGCFQQVECSRKDRVATELAAGITLEPSTFEVCRDPSGYGRKIAHLRQGGFYGRKAPGRRVHRWETIYRMASSTGFDFQMPW